jgi:predicted  nucleic acid-binding Zn-ribbon protein
MLPEVEKLLRVQHHDQKLKSIEKELADIPLEEEDIKDRLTADQEALDQAKTDLQHVEVAIKNLELDVETRRDSIVTRSTPPAKSSRRTRNRSPRRSRICILSPRT